MNPHFLCSEEGEIANKFGRYPEILILKLIKGFQDCSLPRILLMGS